MKGRFVLLKHDHPFLHWDFMLEWGGVLRTWRLPERLSFHTFQLLEIELLGDHRLEYLEYEGEISGGRGSVLREESGTFAVLQETENSLSVQLSGTISGRIELTQLKDQWQLRFESDRASR